MRASGILMHITSLPSPYGVGTLGKAAYAFVDFLQQAGQYYWQILPIGPTGYGNSPYQSSSTFAGNPYLIDLEALVEQGWLSHEACQAVNWGGDPSCVNYDTLEQHRLPLLRQAFARFPREDNNFTQFCRNNPWLEDYALFMAIKTAHNMASWQEWPEELRLRHPKPLALFAQQHAEEVAFWQFVQYIFYRQWRELKSYANQKGVHIIGDIPIYVSADSADVWGEPHLFQLDENKRPTLVAGCPPDAFTAEGQLWGNPLYNWDYHRKNDFRWWVERLHFARQVYDVVRIDHFRGFEGYYAIPAGETTAKNGSWHKGPGLALIETIKSELEGISIIAEDLGFLTSGVRELLEQSGFPGMKVLQFAFDSREESDYLPHNYPHNCVVYTGTHDNDTTLGWFEKAAPEDVDFCKRYLSLTSQEQHAWCLIRAAWASVGNTAIAPMQDFLCLGGEARMNEPSTVGQNWLWRAQPDVFTPALAGQIAELTKLYARFVKAAELNS